MNGIWMILSASLLALMAADSFAQLAQPEKPPARVEAPRPAAKGEPWTAITLYENVAAGDSQPTRRRTQRDVCVAPGKFASSNATSTDLPDEYRESCWVEDKRAERNRRQVKYACKDGMTAEAVVRREADGSFGSKFVINTPGKGGIAITRTFRRAFGVCDLSKVSQEVPITMFKDEPTETPAETLPETPRAAPPAGK